MFLIYLLIYIGIFYSAWIFRIFMSIFVGNLRSQGLYLASMGWNLTCKFKKLSRTLSIWTHIWQRICDPEQAFPQTAAGTHFPGPAELWKLKVFVDNLLFCRINSTARKKMGKKKKVGLTLNSKHSKLTLFFSCRTRGIHYRKSGSSTSLNVILLSREN